jgi:hypothetical protein
MAGAYSDVGEVYDSLGAERAVSAAERRPYRLAALQTYQRSSEIWSDLAARGLVYRRTQDGLRQRLVQSPARRQRFTRGVGLDLSR